MKAVAHPWIDPLLSTRDHRCARRALQSLPAGEYRVGVRVPYYAQFASPERIHDYIHRGYDGTHDPDWHTFGADVPEDYAFWSHRVCALACIKMAVGAFYPDAQLTLWDLVQQGLAVNGYTVRDERGRWVDQGWYVHAQKHLAGLHTG
ncbi:MAG: hypothetical protein JW966_05435 [Anaerolineae bacterium]|nr:hypothetical protein [Anaerolineae bacterium]